MSPRKEPSWPSYTGTLMKPKAHPAPRNPVFLALVKRHGSGVRVMKDRRTPRGGSRNRQKDFAEGRY